VWRESQLSSGLLWDLVGVGANDCRSELWCCSPPFTSRFSSFCRGQPASAVLELSWTSSSSLSCSLNRTLFMQFPDMKPATLRPFLPQPAIRRRILIRRNYAVQAPGNPTLQVFDRHAKYLQKERAAASVERSRQVDYLKDEVAIRLTERLLVRYSPQFRPRD
jgi:hypothetical protein